MATRLASLLRILSPRHKLDHPNAWRYLVLWKQWIQQTTEEELQENQQETRLLSQDPIQSENATVMRMDTMVQWRRMMMRMQDSTCRPMTPPYQTTAPNVAHAAASPSRTVAVTVQPQSRRVPTTNNVGRSDPPAFTLDHDSHTMLPQ